MKRKRVEDFSIGWISALPIEVSAARAVLDEEYEDIDEAAQYVLGRIGKHNVVIACLPAGQIGTGSAATTASRMQSLFPALSYWFMVGIAGGVPALDADVRLGDVVVSTPHGRHGGVVQYDMGKSVPDGKHILTGFLNAPPHVLGTAVNKMRSTSDNGAGRIRTCLSSLADNRFDRRNAGPDSLFEAAYQHAEGSTCDLCSKDRMILRPARENDGPVVHFGLIASGNQVIRDGIHRDRLSAEIGGALCFEMEAAGLMNNLPCLVIRGICDYADSHKNKKWQPFAAAAGAACAKEILSYVPKSNLSARWSLQKSQGLTHRRAHDDQAQTRQENMSEMQSGPQGTSKIGVEDSPFVTSSLSEAKKKEIYESLCFDQINSRHATIRRAQPKTCAWIYETSEHQDWLSDEKFPEHHGFLWIKGHPGTGKSTLMKVLVADAQQELDTSTIISFFFNARGKDLEKSTSGMYRSLLFQLLQKLPDIRDVFKIHRPKPDNMGSFIWSLELLTLLFELAIERIGDRSIVFFIDALDECNDDQVRDTVASFKSLGQLSASSGKKFRVCFSSRHYPHITIPDCIHLVLQEQAEHQQDIACYLDAELQVGNTKTIKQIKTEITTRSSGIFLWVVLVVQMLNEEYAQGNIHTMRKRLNEIPNDLEKLFDDILSGHGQSRQETILCFQWVLHARRPLSIPELYFAIRTGIQPESVAIWNPEELTKNDMRRYILHHSKGLVEEISGDNYNSSYSSLTFIHDGYDSDADHSRSVQFIHETVRGFLLHRTRPSTLALGDPSTFPAQSHDILKKCCHKYYTGVDVDATKDVKSDSEGGQHVQFIADQFPFLQYATAYLLYHSDAAESFEFPQIQFLRDFRLQEWVDLRRLMYTDSPYPPNPVLLEILAAENLPRLIWIEGQSIKGVTSRNQRLESSLAIAVQDQNKAAVEALLSCYQHNPIGEPNVDYTPLPPVAHELQKEFSSIIQFGTAPGMTPLMLAAQGGATLTVKLLLTNPESDVNAHNHRHQSLLSLAAQNGHMKIVEFLLSHDEIEINKKDVYEQSPFSWAAVNNHPEIIKLLLSRGDLDDVSSQIIYSTSPLSWAAEKGHLEIVKRLLSYSAIDINSRSTVGETPILAGTYPGHLEVVKLLLSHADIDIMLEDFFDKTPLFWAASNGNLPMLELFLPFYNTEMSERDCDQVQSALSVARANGHAAITRVLKARLSVQGETESEWLEPH